MRDELVLDASVAGAALFDEDRAGEALALIGSIQRLIAPDLIFAEIASIGAKKVRRGLAAPQTAARALDALKMVLSETVPNADLVERGLALAIEHGVSAYDGLYLSLAEVRGVPVATADLKLIERARAAGLGHLVQRL